VQPGRRCARPDRGWIARHACVGIERLVAVQEAATDAKEALSKAMAAPEDVLRLPELDQGKSAVLNSLTSKDAQRGYRHAIDEFIEWYCSEPRPSRLAKPSSYAYRIHLESRSLAPGTINLRLSPVRRLAYEEADCGLSSDLAAGIRRVKGVKKVGVRLGNWLTSEQSQQLWHCASVGDSEG